MFDSEYGAAVAQVDELIEKYAVHGGEYIFCSFASEKMLWHKCLDWHRSNPEFLERFAGQRLAQARASLGSEAHPVVSLRAANEDIDLCIQARQAAIALRTHQGPDAGKAYVSL